MRGLARYAGVLVVAVLFAMLVAAAGGGRALAGHTPGVTVTGGGVTATLINGTYYLFLPSNYASSTVNVTVTANSGADSLFFFPDSSVTSAGPLQRSYTLNGSLPTLEVCALPPGSSFSASSCDEFSVYPLKTASFDTRLTSLSMSPGSLGFTATDVGTAQATSFDVQVPAATSSVNMSATTEDPLASVQYLVDGQAASSSVTLDNLGSLPTSISVVVTAANGGSQQTYTISVRRGSSDATLSSLTISPGSIDFSPGTKTYDVSVPSGASSVALTPTPNDPNAYEWTINNEDAGTQPSTSFDPEPVPLNDADPTTLTVAVLAEDQVTADIYTVTVTHLAPIALTVAFTGTGDGTITSTAPTSAIACNSSGAAGTCSTSYDEGAAVSLLATPKTGSLFEGWTGSCSGSNPTASFTMPSEAATCTADFLALGAAQSGSSRTVTTTGDDGAATTCYTGLCTLRDALAAVPTGGTIKFANGVDTIHLSSGLTLAGRTVTINGAGVTLDGSDVGAVRTLTVSSGTLIATGLAIVDNDEDGALEIDTGAKATLTNVELKGNGAFYAAGLVANGTVTMNGGEIYNNDAEFCAGLDVGGSATLVNVDISENGAEAIGGGGCVDPHGSLSMSGGDVAANVAQENGGGLDVEGALTAAGTPFILNSAEAQGGAISAEIDGAPVTVALTNVTLGGNESEGGALDLAAGTSATLVNTSIGLNGSAGISGTGITLLNTVIGQNDGPDCLDAPVSDGHNVDADGSCSLSATGDKSDVDSGFGDPNDDGFLTLANGSPALDAGATGTVSGLKVPTTDAEGAKRPQGGGVDIGSIEEPEHKLTIKVVGSGMVEPNVPASPATGVAAPGGWYIAGSTVHLTATPTGDAAFAGWSGPCAGTDPTIAVTLGADATCTATFANAPTITSFSPGSARPGATVRVVGTNLSNATGVAFDGHAAASFKIVSATQLTAVVPADVGSDPGAITVTNAAATDGVASSSDFTPLWPQPRVASFAPAAAKAGATVTIAGSNFLGVTGVSFNGHPATITDTPTDKKLTVTVPDNSDDTGHITVTTRGATPTGTSSGTFTFLPPPTITSFTPEHAVFGTTITITGTALASTTSVLVGGAPAKLVGTPTATTVQVTVPTTASNTPQPISVTNTGGTTESEDNFTLDWAVPAITSISPASARPGATLTIVGSHFTGANAVQFAGHPAVYKVISDTKLTAVVPTNVGTSPVVIEVYNPGILGGSSATPFTPLWPQPKVASFAPAKAKAGATVTIAGSNFLGVSDVSFNGHPATITGTPTDKKLTVTVPDNSDDTGHITVTTRGATPTGTSSGTFTFLPPPTIASFTPEHAVFGATITITGTTFTGTASVSIGGASAKFRVKSATEITAVVPTTASNTPQPISVTNAGGTTLSDDDFTLDWATPTISHFTPAHGAVGAKVTITGTHFTRATGVSFGGTAAVTIKVVNDTTITAVVPVGAATGKIDVSNPGADGESATDFTVT